MKSIINIQPCFVALTRPVMVLGVTLEYLCCNAMVALCGFILFSVPSFLLMFFPLHALGAIACAIDHHFFQLVFKQWQVLPMPNKRLWGCHSYEPF